MSSYRFSLIIMADEGRKWLWSEDVNRLELPDEVVAQAEAWLDKYTDFCANPADEFLQCQFNPEGRNLAGQLQSFFGENLDVFYRPVYPHRKVKRGQPECSSIDVMRFFSSRRSVVEVFRPVGPIEFLLGICEKSGDIAEVDADYYQRMIYLPDKDMQELIEMMLAAMSDHIKDPSGWDNEESLIKNLRMTLFLTMRGMMFFNKSGQLAFFKPTVLPTDEEISLLYERAEEEAETIRRLLWKNA